MEKRNEDSSPILLLVFVLIIWRFLAIPLVFTCWKYKFRMISRTDMILWVRNMRCLLFNQSGDECSLPLLITKDGNQTSNHTPKLVLLPMPFVPFVRIASVRFPFLRSYNKRKQLEPILRKSTKSFRDNFDIALLLLARMIPSKTAAEVERHPLYIHTYTPRRKNWIKSSSGLEVLPRESFPGHFQPRADVFWEMGFLPWGILPLLRWCKGTVEPGRQISDAWLQKDELLSTGATKNKCKQRGKSGRSNEKGE